MDSAKKRKLSAALAGLVLGVAFVLLLPSSWVFVPGERGADETASADDGVQYACPMFCVVMDELPEDGRCPVCGMELAPVTGETSLSADEQQMIGLTVGTVERLPLLKTLRVVGEIDYDETRLSRITTRMAGWLEAVFVDTTWVEVEKGDPLFSIYSPELYEAQQDLIVALRAAGGEAHAVDETLLAAARQRLRLLGVGEDEIEKIESEKKLERSLVIRAPRDEIVVERRALADKSVTKGEVLYTIADLENVWIQTEVFEDDLPWIRVGQAVEIDTESFGAPMSARIAFVDPVIDRSTRTARVRIEVENPPRPNGVRPFRIGQRVDAVIKARVGPDGQLVPPGEEPRVNPLAARREAILATGRRVVAFVLFTETPHGDGVSRDYHLDPENLPEKVWYELVVLRVGPLARKVGGRAGQDYYPVLGIVPDDEGGGLTRMTEGVTIVTSGNLLLDSQAQLSGKPSLLFPEGNRAVPSEADPHAGH